MTHTPTARRRFAGLAISLWLCGTALSAQTPTVTVLFQRASERETTLRASATPATDEIQRTIAAYELVVTKYPTSGYCDNALWQASGLALLSYRLTNRDADRATGERLVQWLTKEYPSSPFVKQADARMQSLASPANRPATTASNAVVAPASSTITSSAAARNAKTGAATLRSISRESLPGGDRIILEVDREVTFTSDRIANPDRVFLDLNATGVGDGVPAAAAALKAMLVTSIRLGHPAAGTTRIVFNLTGAPKHSIYPLYNPYRLVVDTEGPRPPALAKTVIAEPKVVPLNPVPEPVLTPSVTKPTVPPAVSMTMASVPPMPSATASAPTATTPAPVIPSPVVTSNAPASVPGLKTVVGDVVAPNPTGKGDYSMARQLGLGVQRIVIDAGHGGHDPGAHGNGIVEKELVLDVALRLQKLLQDQPGFEVVMTRGTDDFIPLEERTAMANRAGADLFLSIHANASPHEEARGLETYFLNFATTPDAETVAARENASSTQSMGRLPEILKAIALNAKVAESRELATMVQTSMVRRMKTQNATIRDLGVKQAPFVVLIGAEMPSVLAEISFVTNKTEAASLKQAATKQRIAQALFDGIVKYQASLKKITAVAAKDQDR